ncbi:MAG: glucokinase [Xanthomonadales bacterium]|nr:glucokinase [Xanthomonadales bacterium]
MTRNQTEHLLVADIGGTHARFGMLGPNGSEEATYGIHQDRKYRCSEFSSMEQALGQYLTDHDLDSPSHAVIAVAAPVWGDRVQMTNLNWAFSVEAVRRQFGIEQMEVINDASAGVLATTRLDEIECEPVKHGPGREGGARVNLIPGTGFGIGAANLVGGRWVPVQGEGGHIGLAAGEPEEFDVLKALHSMKGRPSPENVLSGPGMLNLYHALARVRDAAPEGYTPAEMTQQALSGEDELCVTALAMYCRLLGSLAGDYALVFGAHGGVYLSGNIIQKLNIDLLKREFVPRFLAKDKMNHEVADIPAFRVQRANPGLLGAAVWLEGMFDPKERHWSVRPN